MEKMKVYLLNEQQKTIKSIQNEIWKLLCDADEEFYPPLSVRDAENVVFDDKERLKPTGKPTTFFQEVMNQYIIVAVNDNIVVGFLSFEKDYINNDLISNKFQATWYVNALVVNPKYRRRGIATYLYDEIERLAINQTKDIFTRTWNANHSHIKLVLNRGYKLVLKLLDHRGKGKHTVYYQKIIPPQKI